jgi:hypothetical protein
MRTVGGSLTSHTPPHTVLIPHPRTSQLTISVWGGWGLGSGGWATNPPPTPQAGRVTDSDGGGCESSSATLSNGQFIQKRRGDNSNVADVTRIHYAPSPKALNFTACLLLRRVTSLRALSYGA